MNEGILQKVFAPCLRCNNEVSGFLVPDGRFICPNCDPPPVYEHWTQIWEPFERAFQARQRNAQTTEPVPKRKFWQFHLSTLIMLAILSSIPVSLNSHQRVLTDDTIEYVYGWPCDAVYWLSDGVGHHYEISWLNLPLNLLTMLLVLTPFLCASEWLIRRREQGKEVKVHLSTVVVLTLVAGGFLRGNIVPDRYTSKVNFDNRDFTVPWIAQGFPFRFADHAEWGALIDARSEFAMICVNIAAGILSLFVVAFFLEWLIRRRRLVRYERD